MSSTNSRRPLRRKRKLHVITPLEEAIRSGLDQDGFEVKFIDKDIGHGVFTTKQFSQGDFLLQYKGELITYKEGVKREKAYPTSKGSFLFFFFFDGKRLCLDATEDPFENNKARMINDDVKNPNCVLRKITSNGQPNLCVFARRDLNIGDELRYDYGVQDLPWRQRAWFRGVDILWTEQGDTQVPHTGTPQISTCAPCEVAGRPVLANFEAQQTDTRQTIPAPCEVHVEHTPCEVDYTDTIQTTSAPCEEHVEHTPCEVDHTDTIQTTSAPCGVQVEHTPCEVDHTDTLQTASAPCGVQVEHTPCEVDHTDTLQTASAPCEVHVEHTPCEVDHTDTLQTASAPCGVQEERTPCEVDHNDTIQTTSAPCEVQVEHTPCEVDHTDTLQTASAPCEVHVEHTPCEVDHTDTLQTASAPCGVQEERTPCEVDHNDTIQTTSAPCEVHVEHTPCEVDHTNTIQTTSAPFEVHVEHTPCEVDHTDTLQTASAPCEVQVERPPCKVDHTDTLQTTSAPCEVQVERTPCELDHTDTIQTTSAPCEVHVEHTSCEVDHTDTIQTTSAPCQVHVERTPCELDHTDTIQTTSAPCQVQVERTPCELDHTDTIQTTSAPCEVHVEHTPCDLDHNDARRTPVTAICELTHPSIREMPISVSLEVPQIVPRESSVSAQTYTHQRHGEVSDEFSVHQSQEFGLDADDMVPDSNNSDSDSVIWETLQSADKETDAKSSNHSVDRVKDSSKTSVYYTSVQKKKLNIKGKKKKSARVWNRRNCCVFCRKLVSNISKHLRKTHHDKPEIQAIVSMENRKDIDLSKDVKIQLDLIRNKGNHMHNKDVLEKGCGELIIARREAELAEFDKESYSPCSYCFLWLKESALHKHTSYRCPVKMHGIDCPSSASVVMKGRVMKGMYPNVSEQLLKEVLPIMKEDTYTRTAQTDELILQLGEHWLAKACRNKLRRKNYASDHMRRAAKLLNKCRLLQYSGEMTMSSYLTPGCFDVVLQAAVSITGKGLEDMQHPSVALKLGHDLKKMAEIKEIKGIKHNNDEAINEAKAFLKLLKREWPTRVAAVALRTAEERKFEKKVQLPNPTDLKKLSEYLISTLKTLDLPGAATWTNYQSAVTLVQVRLATFNKRRPGELEALRLSTYLARDGKKDVLQDDIASELTTLEKKLYALHDLVTVRGKRGRPVPILIPSDVQAALGFITNPSTRLAAGLGEAAATYVFANRGAGVIRVTDSIRDVCHRAEVELAHPELVRCTVLRQYIATTTQMLSLEANEMNWVVQHLGHSMNVHKTYYRMMSSTLERAKLAKLLILADQGLLGKHIGKSLQELNFEDVSLGTSGGMENEEPVETGGEPSEDVACTAAGAVEFCEENGRELDHESDSDMSAEEIAPPKRKRKQNSGRWGSKESSEVERYFTAEIREMKVPGMDKCVEFLKFSKHCRRKWQDVKNKLNASIQREKRRHSKRQSSA